MAEIKKWFQKKKMDIKFIKAGGGHRLTEDEKKAKGGRTVGDTRPAAPAPSRSTQPADDSKARAAQAALQRFESRGTSAGTSRSHQAIRSQALKEIEALSTGLPNVHVVDEKEFEHAPLLTVQGVFYTCPILGESLRLPRAEVESRLDAFLREQFTEEPLMASAAMITSLNRSAEKRNACVETIQRYIANILEHPEEEKYRKIRRANRAYAERVASCTGGRELLDALGFREKEIQNTEGILDQFLMLESHDLDRQKLNLALEYLASTEPIPVILDRDVHVLKPGHSTADRQVKLPPEFYDKTVDEVKREQAEKVAETDKVLALKTREMREREELKRIYKYRFTLIRVKFPDEFILQGTFRSAESLDDVESFLRPHLAHPDLPLVLKDSLGKNVSQSAVAQNDDGSFRTLAQLGLAPAALLRFEWDPDVAASGVNEYLNAAAKSMASEL